MPDQRISLMEEIMSKHATFKPTAFGNFEVGARNAKSLSPAGFVELGSESAAKSLLSSLGGKGVRQ